MKKIFLTSGIVVCMACPAFATGFGTEPYNTDPQQLTQTGACVEPSLGVYSGPTTLKAIWNPNKGAIPFVSHSHYTPTQCGANPTEIVHKNSDGTAWENIFTPATYVTDDDTVINITALYSTYGVAVYPTSALQNADTNNNGTGGITSLTTIPALTGYTFDGYYDDTNEDNVIDISQDTEDTIYIYADGSFVEDSNRNGHYLVDTFVTESNGSKPLYAHWTPKTYTITYACGTAGSNNVSVKQESGEDVSLTQSVTYDDCYSLDSVDNRCAVPGGYTFAGWSCTAAMPGADADADSGYYDAADGGVWTNDGNVTCTAMWTANTINITWDGDGAENWTAPSNNLGGTTSCVYESNVTLPAKPSKTGYTFGGWAVDNSNSGSENSSGNNNSGNNNSGGNDEPEQDTGNGTTQFNPGDTPEHP